MSKFGINGFGRIGRNVLRAMSQQQVERVIAINDLTDTRTLAHLLKWDSIHGKFDGEVGYDNENIAVRGHKIKVLKERDILRRLHASEQAIDDLDAAGRAHPARCALAAAFDRRKRRGRHGR